MIAQFCPFLNLKKNKRGCISRWIITTFMLWAPPPRTPYKLSNNIKITDTIHLTTGKYFLKIFFFSSGYHFLSSAHSAASEWSFAFTLKGHYIFSPAYPWGHLRSFAMTHSPYRQDLNYTHLSPGAQVWHPIDNMLLQSNSLDTLIKDIQIQI